MGKITSSLLGLAICSAIATTQTQENIDNTTQPQDTEKPLNDAAMRRRDKGTLTIHHATAYEYMGNPTQATQLIWLHLPMDISTALNAPMTMFKLAQNLQDTCDAAYLAMFNDAKSGFNNTKQTLELAIQHHTQKRLTRGAWGPKKTKFKHLKKYRSQTLPRARAYCKYNNMRLTQPADPNSEYRHELTQFLEKEQINGIIIEKTFSKTDNLNRLPPLGRIPSEAFPNSRNTKVKIYNPKQRRFEEGSEDLWHYDDDNDVIYVFTRHGKLEAYFTNINGDYTQEYLRDKGVSDQDYSTRSYLKKTPVVCEDSRKNTTTTTSAKTQNKTQENNRNSGTYLGTLQTCYHTVDHIELAAVTADMRMATMWQQHNLIIDTQGDNEKQFRRQTRVATATTKNDTAETWRTEKLIGLLRGDTDEEINVRQKRFLGLVIKGVTALATSGLTRKFAKQMLPLIGLNKIKKITPQSRKAFKLMSKLKHMPVALPALIGTAGLGYGVWSNYKTNKKFSEQRRTLINSRKHLNEQSTTLQTLKMDTITNEEDIQSTKEDMINIQNEFLQVRHLVHSIDAAVTLQNTIMQVRMKNDEIRDIANNNIAEISETLISVRANVIPGVFTPTLRKGAAQLGIDGKQLLPNPERPINLSPLISEGQLDLYANFLAGTDKWEMYRITPIPKFRDNKAYTRKADFEYALIGLAQERYIALDLDEARACKRGACKTTGVIRFLADDPCTVRMLSLGEPDKNCHINESPGDPFLRSTASGLIYSVPEKVTGRLHCEGAERAKIGHDGTIVLDGMGIVNIPPGCALITNAPDVAKIIGPPREHDLRANNTLIQHVGKAIAPKPEKDNNNKRTEAIKAATQLTHGVKRNNKRIAGMTTAIIMLIIASVVLILIFTGKIACVALLHRKVMKKIAKANTAAKTAKQAMDHGFNSIVKHADGLTKILQDRNALNNYLEGTTHQLPLQHHVSTINLAGEKEKHTLGFPRPEEAEISFAGPTKEEKEGPNNTEGETNRKFLSHRKINELYPDPRPQ